MNEQTNNRIRDEWKKRFYERFGGEGTIAKTDENCILIAFTKGEVIDFIAELLKLQREELVELLPNEQIHTLPDGVNSPHETEFDRGWNSYRRKLLSLIKQSK